MTIHRWLLCSLIAFCIASTTRASILETWESQLQTDPFTGTGDRVWTGDVSAWSITTATWPQSPNEDFAGVRSLRSTNHGSTSTTIANETVVTNITGEVSLTNALEWSVFFSGNSADIQPNRRADFILLADKSSISAIEDPVLLNGFKITLNDPFNAASGNIPPFSHEDNTLGDSLTLWSVTASDDRWRVVGSIPLGSTMDLSDGWNIRARLDNGKWSIGFANGAIGQTPALTFLGPAAGGPALSSFLGNAYAGVGWTAPNNTTNDYTDFGFDNFRVVGQAIPEPAMLIVFVFLIGSSLAMHRMRGFAV